MERPPAANVLASVGAHQYKTRWAGRAPWRHPESIHRPSRRQQPENL